MFNILIATHGKMSDGIKDAVLTITGMDVSIETINLTAGKQIEKIGEEVREIIDSEKSKEGLLIFTDIIAASPYNQSLLAVKNSNEEQQDKVIVLGGVNLPMVLEAVNHQLLSSDLRKVCDLIQEAGHHGIDKWNIAKVEDNSNDDDDDF